MPGPGQVLSADAGGEDLAAVPTALPCFLMLTFLAESLALLFVTSAFCCRSAFFPFSFSLCQSLTVRIPGVFCPGLFCNKEDIAALASCH